MIDPDVLEQFTLEADANHVGKVWIEVWHDNCGEYLVDDAAQRISFDLRELVGKATTHLLECDR